jgi:hypothetical protein
MSTAQRFRTYYQTERYKGFYNVSKDFNSSSKMTTLVFSNGKKKIYSCGMFTEDAMFKAFKAIDKYHQQNKHKSISLVEA